jgi:FlaA1/EpsC-like NDP-sugar epimerase
VGAGNAGQLVIRELRRNRALAYTPIGFIDDNPKKRKLKIDGVRVLGTTDELVRILRESPPDEVLIAMPSAPGEVRRKIVDVTRAEGIPVKTLPGLHELIAGDLNLATQIRPVQVEDVLGREQVEVDLEQVAAYVRDRAVLVTGAGGSIGSELCRQLARLGAARLVLVEQSESALYEMERELVDERAFPAAIPVLADCGDRVKMRHAFQRFQPAVVFHAAAYKHVPMLEANPLQAVTNNVLATRVLAEVAIEFGVERFVMISTDKAAKPKNLLGQSKAVCEWIVESFAARDEVETRFVAVRFGNVLGSSGSVIPIFRRQIERGGPITVTDPRMTRFFMTIPEAASLVVQSGSMGGSGQVYVLDMGAPVRIVDLARQMIELSGRTEEQIPITFVGARAGEKLHEELWNEGEDVGPTKHPKIMRARRVPIDREWLEDELAELERLVGEGDTLGVVAKLGTMMREQQRTGAAMLEDTLH